MRPGRRQSRRRRSGCGLSLLALALLAAGAGLLWRSLNARLRYVPAQILAPPRPVPPAQAARAEQNLRAAVETLESVRRLENAAAAAAPTTTRRPARPGTKTVTPPGRAAPTPLESPASRPYQITLGENDLNTLLRTHTGKNERLGRAGVRAATIRLRPGGVRVGALLDPEQIRDKLPNVPGLRALLGQPTGAQTAPSARPLYVEANGTLAVNQERLVLHLSDVRLGQVEAPPALTREIVHRLAVLLARAGKTQAPAPEVSPEVPPDALVLPLPGRVEQARLENGRLIVRGVVTPGAKSSGGLVLTP